RDSKVLYRLQQFCDELSSRLDQSRTLSSSSNANARIVGTKATSVQRIVLKLIAVSVVSLCFLDVLCRRSRNHREDDAGSSNRARDFLKICHYCLTSNFRFLSSISVSALILSSQQPNRQSGTIQGRSPQRSRLWGGSLSACLLQAHFFAGAGFAVAFVAAGFSSAGFLAASSAFFLSSAAFFSSSACFLASSSACFFSAAACPSSPVLPAALWASMIFCCFPVSTLSFMKVIVSSMSWMRPSDTSMASAYSLLP